eukprot:GHRR01000498.1.p1 GENE.GHRR01000498.1~~GHRR01000498.1.p1  ORF type:complete len:283 (+),score=59.09 GHRR01000498.1:120-968(+)
MNISCCQRLVCDALYGKRFPRPLPSHGHTLSTRNRHLTKNAALHKSLAKRAVSKRAVPKKNAGNSKKTPEPTDYSSRKQKVPGDSGWDLLKLRNTNISTFNRFREVEVIHARWAMLGVIALLLGDLAGSPFPPKEVTVSSLAPWGFVFLLSAGFIESYRMAALWGEDDVEKRTYPGKRFDVLGLTASNRQKPDDEPPGLGVYASWIGGLPGWLAGGWWFDKREMTEVELLDMKNKELRNGRLAMVSFIGCFMASLLTGKGPITLLVEHLSDPLHNTIIQNLQ